MEICALDGDTDQNRLVGQHDSRVVRKHSGEVLDQMSGNYLVDLDLDGRWAWEILRRQR